MQLIRLTILSLLINLVVAYSLPKLPFLSTLNNQNDKSNLSIKLPRNPHIIKLQGYMNRGMNKIKKETPKMFKKNMTNVLLYINVFVYLVNLVFPSSRYALMKIDQLISRGEQYRLLSSCIVHGSLIHLGFNMYSLYNTGPYIEKIFGPERFTTFYILSGVLANIGTYIIRSSPYALGASGCIYGILGALTTYFYRNREYLYDAEAQLSNMKRTLAMNAIYSLQSGVDGAAHLGGFLGGALLSYLFGPRLYVSPSPFAYGRPVLKDRPLLNYVPYWKMLVSPFRKKLND